MLKCPRCSCIFVCKEDLNLHLKTHFTNKNMLWSKTPKGYEWGKADTLPYLKKLCLNNGYVEKEGYTYWLSQNKRWLYRKSIFT
jgi:hypothetical protein